MRAFEKLPEYPLGEWGKLSKVTHYRAMKAISECNPPELYAIIQEWKCENHSSKEYLTYLTYFRAWHYILSRDEDAWGAFIDALTALENSDEIASVREKRICSAIASSMWCAAIRGDFELTVSLSTMAVGKGEPRPTARLALTLADRNREACLEQLPAALEALKAFEPTGFYSGFLEQLFSESSLDLIFKGPTAEF